MEAVSRKKEFLIITDHKSLSYLQEQNLHSDMQRKAMTRLIGLQFKVIYRKCKENVAADALSRMKHLMMIQTVSTIQPLWIQEVANSYVMMSKPRSYWLNWQCTVQIVKDILCIRELSNSMTEFGLGKILDSRLKSSLLFTPVLWEVTLEKKALIKELKNVLLERNEARYRIIHCSMCCLPTNKTSAF